MKIYIDKKHGFSNILKKGLSYLSQLADIFPQIAEGTKNVMKNIDYGIIPIEKRILRKITYLLILFFGSSSDYIHIALHSLPGK